MYSKADDLTLSLEDRLNASIARETNGGNRHKVSKIRCIYNGATHIITRIERLEEYKTPHLEMCNPSFPDLRDEDRISVISVIDNQINHYVAYPVVFMHDLLSIPDLEERAFVATMFMSTNII